MHTAGKNGLLSQPEQCFGSSTQMKNTVTKLCSIVMRGSTNARFNSAALHPVMLHCQINYGVRSDASLKILVTSLVSNDDCYVCGLHTSVWPGFV